MGVTITGVAEVTAAFGQLGEKGTKRVLRKALRAGAKVVQAQLVANAPVKSGATRRSVKIKGASTRGDTVSLSVQLSPDAITGKKVYYFPWENTGHFTGKRIRVKGRRRKGNQVENDAAYKVASLAAGRKWVPGSHWVERSRDQSEEAAGEAMAGSIEQQVAAITGG